MICCPDTHLLVYVQDGRDPGKQAAAGEIYRALASRTDACVGLQVLGELYAVLTRKLRQPPATAAAAVRAVGDVFEPFGYEAADVHSALALVERGILSYWDALLISAAARVGCAVLISEDMHDTFRFGDLDVIAPFVGGERNPRLDFLFDGIGA